MLRRESSPISGWLPTKPVGPTYGYSPLIEMKVSHNFLLVSCSRVQGMSSVISLYFLSDLNIFRCLPTTWSLLWPDLSCSARHQAVVSWLLVQPVNGTAPFSVSWASGKEEEHLAALLLRYMAHRYIMAVISSRRKKSSSTTLDTHLSLSLSWIVSRFW